MFCYLPASSAASSMGIFATAAYSANQTNKGGGMCHQSVYLSLDVYACWPVAADELAWEYLFVTPN